MRSRLSVRRRGATPQPVEDWEWWTCGDTPDLLIAGHSNRLAFSAAITEGLIGPDAGVALLERPRDLFERQREANGAPLVVALNPHYWKRMYATPAKALVVVWEGNQHNHHFLLETVAAPVRLYGTGGDGDAVVPVRMISALWADTLKGIEAVVSQSRAERVIVSGTPPPKSEDGVRRGLSSSPHFASEIAASGATVAEIPITPGPTRVALWRVLQEDVERAATRAGADFVAVPEAVQTPEGYLKPEFSAGDATHANPAFAAAMLEELRKHMGSARA